MDILSNLEVNRTIDEFMERNLGKVELSLDEIEEIKDMFNVLMKDETNSNKSVFEQKSLIEDLAIGKSYGEKTERLVRSHSSNKHMDFFDTFLGEGEADKIQEALYKNGLPTSVLRGIKAKKEIYIPTKTDVGLVEVRGKIEPSPDGTNSQDDFFEVLLNGKAIYSWTPDYTLVDLPDLEEECFDEVEPQESQNRKVKVPSVEKAEGQKTVKKVTENTSDGDTKSYQYYYTKKGNLAVRITKNGIFVGGGLVK